MIFRDFFQLRRRQMVADGIRNHKIAVRQPLHQGAGAEAIGAVIGEVRFTQDVQTFDVAHQVVIDPKPSHRIVDSRKDSHWLLVRVFGRNFVVHVKQVAIFLSNRVFTIPLDGIAEVQENGKTSFPNAMTRIAAFFCCARRNIARSQIAVRRVTPFQIVVAFSIRNLIRGAFVALGRWHPDSTIVAQTFAHQRQLGLIIAGDRDTRWMNLRVAGICEQGTFSSASPRGRDVGAFCHRRKIIDVAVTAGRQNHGVSCVGFELPRCEVANHDAARQAIDDHQFQHFATREEFDLAGGDLSHHRLIGTQQQLLSGLAAAIKCSRNLSPTEGAVRQGSTVLACERNTLSHALIDDVVRHLSETMHVGFAGSIIATFERVVKQTPDTVAVVLVIFSGIDSALSRDAVGSARAVLKAERFDVVAQFAHRSCSRSSSQSGANHNHAELALVGRIDQLHVENMFVPLLLKRTIGNSRVQCVTSHANHRKTSEFLLKPGRLARSPAESVSRNAA